jgi:nitric oxide reductase NorD protein
MAEAPLTAGEIEERLDAPLDAVLSSRRTAAAPAQALAGFTCAQQELVLRWVEIIAVSSAEVAYQYACAAPRAFALLDEAGVEDWVIHFMDVYDKEGLYPAVQALEAVEAFSQARAARASGLALDEVAGVLETFIHGLHGRRLKIAADARCYTDTETLHLPALITRFTAREDHFALYKAMAVHQWAQCWFGTFRLSLADTLARFPEPARALGQFHALETLRLDAAIGRELPGLARLMRQLRLRCAETPLPAQWQAIVERLGKPGANVHVSHALLPMVYDWEIPAPACYQGTLEPECVEAMQATRLARDKQAFRSAVARMQHEREQRGTAAEAGPVQIELCREERPDLPDGFTYHLELDGQPLTPTEDVRAVMDSILQDLGEIPEEYLQAAGEGGYRMDETAHERDPTEVWKGTYHEEGAFLYDEWDHTRAHYRKQWCVLRELDVHPDPAPFVRDTLARHTGLVKQLRRSFEALRGEDRLLKKQPHGDEVDIDALVEALADARAGHELGERLFLKRHKLERNIAVMFMVDMSGSTKGWINEAEREALVLLAEALETLGDRYAIYGFSGMTRKRCELYRVKRFDEPYCDAVRARISGIKPQDYTRMGVTIRHLSTLLDAIEARTKLLITLSDGKPDDYDGYRGRYGIEDTRMSLIEAKRRGIHPFCITIDHEARDYLPHMYGAVNWTLVEDVKQLPLKVSDIYRRLTM